MTRTEEDYIKAIFKISEQIPNQTVNTNAISNHLKTSAASVTDMIKKLAEKSLLNYEKYKGVTLTDTGHKTATFLIRKHRLWETFLYTKLSYKWDEVHDIAEQLEHIKSDNLIERLDAYLGYPKYDPHGDPIPDANGVIQMQKTKALHHLELNQTSTVVGLKHHDNSFLNYLDEINVKIKTQITLINKSSFDGSIKVIINDQTQIISSKAAELILMDII